MCEEAGGNTDQRSIFLPSILIFYSCFHRKDGTLPIPFEQDKSKSQLWNEMCFIHCLRMIAIGIDDEFQEAVEETVGVCAGDFRKVTIKGYGRMKNKCRSKDDHYFQAYPR